MIQLNTSGKIYIAAQAKTCRPNQLGTTACNLRLEIEQKD
jgi:hypothetical protein